MLAGNKLISIMVLSTFVIFGNETNLNHHYNSGKEAYRNGQYELAIQKFESILGNKWVAPQLYYNLGNAYFRQSNTGGAVWAYESALQINPGHENAVYNLKLANLKVKDRVEIPVPPFYFRWYLSLLERFTSTDWINFTAGFLLLYALCFLLYSLTEKYLFRILKSNFITLFIVCSLISIHSVQKSANASLGIISQTQAEVRSEPNSFSTRLFDVHEGLKVSVIRTQNNWIEIELVDGKKGWIEYSYIREL